MNLLNKTLYELVTQNEKIAQFLYDKQVIKEDNTMINTLGKKLTLGITLQSKKINKEIFIKELETYLNQSDFDLTLVQAKEEDKNIKIKGVLPCPVRIQMLEKVEEFKQKNDCDDFSIELQAASMGLTWLKDSVKNANSSDDIADLYLSAGFELFFDKDLIGKFRDENIFENYSGIAKYNSDFENDTISLRDPKGLYSVLAVVPAVFLVNENELGGRPIPTSWEEILSEEWENSVSISVGDFDMFNALLLNMYKLYGFDGIKKLARSFHKSMHPSEMVTSNRKNDKPAVSIMPFFFSKMAKKPMTIVWPKEGAVLSPIFMLSKKDKKKELKPVVDFFSGKEIGEILSHQGRFPSVHPEVDNMLSSDYRFVWVGWDMIHNEDISALIQSCKEIFEANTI
ncbi:MAG: ABC transporter substrate-binding protein [Eubacteriales bacterium]|nr:ABC transporter substrate-binding protein [Eubacteriales bacterium]